MKNNTIILLDCNNPHGATMYTVLSFYSNNVIWDPINENNIIDILKKYQNYSGYIFCIPVVWNKNTNALIEEIASKNIVIAPKDDELLYPWSAKGVIVAETSSQFGDLDWEIGGECAQCVWLALKYLQKSF